MAPPYLMIGWIIRYELIMRPALKASIQNSRATEPAILKHVGVQRYVTQIAMPRNDVTNVFSIHQMLSPKDVNSGESWDDEAWFAAMANGVQFQSVRLAEVALTCSLADWFSISLHLPIFHCGGALLIEPPHGSLDRPQIRLWFLNGWLSSSLDNYLTYFKC